MSVIERCPQLRGFRYISGRRGMSNKAVEHNMAAFSELSFAVHWQGRLVLRITALSNGKLLTTATMVDNLAKKVENCPLNRSCQVLFAYN